MFRIVSITLYSFEKTKKGEHISAYLIPYGKTLELYNYNSDIIDSEGNVYEVLSGQITQTHAHLYEKVYRIKE